MTYWHMQMYTDYLEKEGHIQEPEKELLEQIGVIGVGEDKNSYIKQFKEDMQIGDIVVVRRGGRAIALVEIIGDISEKKKDKNAKDRLDWFKYRRKIRVLDYAIDMPSFPQKQGMLQKSLDKNTKTYKYINEWYEKLYAIKEVSIDEYKMFHNLKINFRDNISVLPIIVIAGINGTGKTSLLEYLKEEFQNQSVYFPAGIGDIGKVADEFVKTFYSLLKNKDYRPSEVKKHLDKFMKDIFDELELTFSYSHLDKDDNVWFTNDNGKKFKINELSTGEKTLLSKILFIFFKGYKNKVLLIDEPELSLHPSWQNQILKVYEKLAQQNNCQIIIATHSPHIIASAKNKYLRFLIKEDNKIVVKQLSESPLNRDVNTILKTLMGANYKPKELEELQLEYRRLFDEGKLETEEAKELEEKILKYESLNSAFFQGIAFDKALME